MNKMALQPEACQKASLHGLCDTRCTTLIAETSSDTQQHNVMQLDVHQHDTYASAPSPVTVVVVDWGVLFVMLRCPLRTHGQEHSGASGCCSLDVTWLYGSQVLSAVAKHWIDGTVYQSSCIRATPVTVTESLVQTCPPPGKSTRIYHVVCHRQPGLWVYNFMIRTLRSCAKSQSKTPCC